MNDQLTRTLKKYNDIRRDIEVNFTGLPYAPSILIGLLITRANPCTGLIEDITYRDLAVLLTVSKAPGRKDSGTPKKETIRSYLRTIETQCGEHFKVISDGQSLKIQLLTLPTIYALHFKCGEVYTPVSTGQSTHKTIIKTDLNASNKDELHTEQHTDLYTSKGEQAINACAKENIKQNNNNNKHESSKLPISDSFFPSEEILQRARTLGLDNADDFDEIQAFIDHNKASGSLWADFNPIYLRWLIQSQERRKRAALTATERRTQHGTSTNRHFDKRTPKERVIAAYSDTLKYCEHTHRFNTKTETAACIVPIRYLDSHTLDATN